MRPLILKMSMSLDGFVSGPNGESEWMFSGDPEAVAWSADAVGNASLHIMGSRTFQAMAGFWPTNTGPFAAPMNEIPKAVFSRQGPAILAPFAAGRRDPAQDAAPPRAAGADSWAEAYVADGDLSAEIAALKAEDGKPIIAHGGGGFARSLIAADLIDEFVLLVHPIALGKGVPIFSDLAAPRKLARVDAKAFPGGSVAQVYRRA